MGRTIKTNKINFEYPSIIVPSISDVNSVICNPLILGESSHIGNYSYDKINTSGIIAKDYATGWKCATSGSMYLDFELPTIVLVGDSIMEGRPYMYSRVNIDNAGTCDLTKENLPNQPSYNLAEIFGLPVLNHGIGGQRTDQVLGRWNRDVLGETDNGFPTPKTLNKKPIGVIINVGINDIHQGIALSTIQANLQIMVQSCKDNNIYCCVCNLINSLYVSAPNQQRVRDLNTWINANLTDCTIIDLSSWSNGFSGSYGLRTDFNCFEPDNQHPTPIGYKSMCKFIAESIPYPFWLKEIEIQSFIDTLTNDCARPNQVTFSSNGYSKTISLENKEIQKITDIIPRGYKQRLTIDTTSSVTGNNNLAISGIKVKIGGK